MILREVKISPVKPREDILVSDTTPEAPVPSKLTLETGDGLELIPVNTLPSAFLPYPVKEFYIRGLTVEELKLLSKLEDSFSYKALLALFDEWKLIQGISVYEIAPVDFKALLFLISHYTDPDFHLQVSVNCPFCGKHNTRDITLEDIDWQELKEKSIDYTCGSSTFHFRYFTMGDLITLEEYKGFKAESPLAALGIASLPRAVEDIWSALDEALKKIGSLPGRVSRNLGDLERRVLPDLNPFEFKCSGCTSPFHSSPQLTPLDLFDL